VTIAAVIDVVVASVFWTAVVCVACCRHGSTSISRISWEAVTVHESPYLASVSANTLESGSPAACPAYCAGEVFSR